MFIIWRLLAYLFSYTYLWFRKSDFWQATQYHLYALHSCPLLGEPVIIINGTSVTKVGKYNLPMFPLGAVGSTGGVCRCRVWRGLRWRRGWGDWRGDRGFWGDLVIHQSGDLTNRGMNREAPMGDLVFGYIFNLRGWGPNKPRKDLVQGGEKWVGQRYMKLK